MKKHLIAFLVSISLASAAVSPAPAVARLSRPALLDKIKGAWAGQMIGVAYGATTEFKAKGRMYTEEIKPEALSNAIIQDDLYVEMTFVQVLDRLGMQATAKDFGAAFKDSKYKLWHANASARRNLDRGIQPPLSGEPRYNIHADDIDFQIEADFIGIISPGLPQASNQLCDRVGRVMNSGDGLYGGMFVGGMYSAAYFESDPRRLVEAGLACIPEASGYAQVLRDVLRWSAEKPSDWRAVWQQLADKWDKDDPCPDGAFETFNIDAKLNGAYIAIGLIYGAGDWQKTMEVATRCGQDSDCNPSSAAGVLGAMIGYERIPQHHRDELAKIADTKFDFTNYSFNDIVKSSEAHVLRTIATHGGRVTDSEVFIQLQVPTPPPLEQSKFGKPVRRLAVSDEAWAWNGAWQNEKSSMLSNEPGNEVSIHFEGTGIALVGALRQDGGRADVFIDGVKQDLIADAYIAPNTYDNDLWHVFGLKDAEHTLLLVVRADADPRSQGRRITLGKAVIYKAD